MLVVLEDRDGSCKHESARGTRATLASEHVPAHSARVGLARPDEMR